jgi:hypothetical protein
MPILSQMNTVHTFQINLPKIHLILSSHIRLGLPIIYYDLFIVAHVQNGSGAHRASYPMDTHLSIVPRSKNTWSYTSTSPICLHGVVLIKHRDNYTFTLPLTGALSLGVKLPRREADHSHPSSAEVKECVEIYLHSPTTPSWRGS